MGKIEYTTCDYCEKKIELADTCGFGQKYVLTDAWCNQCGGKSWDFCSFICLKKFVNCKLEKAEKEVDG